MAKRVLACTTCHGKEGRATSEGYFPRIAGKPAGYLYNQLVNFRDGRRTYAPMTYLIDHLSDAYLLEIAQHFASLELPYPPPQTKGASPEVLARGKALVFDGAPDRDIPACAQCHGKALTGVKPAVPGLLGLPRDYLNGPARRVADAPAARDCARLHGDHRGETDDAGDRCDLHLAVVATGAGGFEARIGACRTAADDLRQHPAMKLPVRIVVAVVLLAFALIAALGARVAPRGEGRGRGRTFRSHGAADRARRIPGAGRRLRRLPHRARRRPYAGGKGIETPFGTVYASTHAVTRRPVRHLVGCAFPSRAARRCSRNGHLLYPAFLYPTTCRSRARIRMRSSRISRACHLSCKRIAARYLRFRQHAGRPGRLADLFEQGEYVPLRHTPQTGIAALTWYAASVIAVRAMGNAMCSGRHAKNGLERRHDSDDELVCAVAHIGGRGGRGAMEARGRRRVC